jgi:predicted nucleotidyltransferase component of viral defense system
MKQFFISNGWRFLEDGELTKFNDIVCDTDGNHLFSIGTEINTHFSVGEIHEDGCMNIIRKVQMLEHH